MNKSLVLYESNNPIEILNNIQKHICAEAYNKCSVNYYGFNISGYTKKDNFEIIGKRSPHTMDSLRGYRVQRIYIEMSLYNKIPIEDFHNVILPMLKYEEELAIHIIDKCGNIIAKIYRIVKFNDVFEKE